MKTDMQQEEVIHDRSIFLLCSSFLFVLVLFDCFRQQEYFAIATPYPPAGVDALVVLGCAVNHYTSEVSAPLLSRLKKALQVYCQTAQTQALSQAQGHEQGSQPQLPYIIMTGGSSWQVEIDKPTEAEIMMKKFQQLWQQEEQGLRKQYNCMNVKEPTFILEKTSTSTLLNARNTIQILLTSYPHIKRLHIVTNKFHQYRSLKVFEQVERKRREGFLKSINQQQRTTQTELESSSSSSSSTSSSSFSSSSYVPFEFSVASFDLSESNEIRQFDFLREILANLLYAARGWIQI